MRRYILTGFVLTMFVWLSFIGGCSSSNKEGQPASLSTDESGPVSADNNIQAEITGVTISSAPVVTFTLFDEKGAALDPAPLLATRGIRFYIAQIKADGNYANYFGTSSPSYDTAGKIAALGGGTYTYTFSRDITNTPNFGGLVYDANRTHTAAIQVSRSIADAFGGAPFQQAKNVYFNFRPAGGAVTQTREIVATSSCNECHGKLALHGGSRREVVLCILCHNPGLTVNGVSFDFKVMVHKIHMGEKLPGNSAAVALGGYGYSIGSRNYAEVGYPFISGDSKASRTPIECVKCHRTGQDINGRPFGKDVDKWKGDATIGNCTTCHDTTAFGGVASVNVADATRDAAGRYTPKLTAVAAAPHFMPGPWTDRECRGCHLSEVTGNNAYKMSIVGHHTVFEKSSVFTGLNFQILSVTNATAGNKPTVTFRITDQSGTGLSPAETGSSYSLKAGYFTAADYTNDGMANYGQPLSQALAAASANGDGSYTITFTNAIPASASGTGVIGLEGRRSYTIPATERYPSRTVRAGGKSVQYFFDVATGAQVTDPAKQRRASVDDDKCILCHGRVSLHGSNRVNSVQECAICHNPKATDRSQRPAAPVDGLTSQSINLKDMIHKIHTGESLEASKVPLTTGGVGYIIYGNGNSVNDFGKVRYPRDRRDCLACHVTKNPIVYGLPLPDGVLGTTTLTGATISNGVTTFTSTIQPPMTAACVSCHDTPFSVSHAANHVTGSGAAAVEGCVACHRTGLLQGVDFSHKAIR